MNAVLQNLLKLQAIEFDEPPVDDYDAKVAELRREIPQPVLGHYDRLRARGKKGVAVVRNQVCTGCHMQQPLAKVMIVMRDEDIQLCDSCGRYLYLPSEAERQFVENVAAAAKAPEKSAGEAAAPKAPRKPRKRRETQAAAVA